MPSPKAERRHAIIKVKAEIIITTTTITTMNGNLSGPSGGALMALLNPAPIIVCICLLMALEDEMHVNEEHLRTMIRNTIHNKNSRRNRRLRDSNDNGGDNLVAKRRKKNWDHERAYR